MLVTFADGVVILLVVLVVLIPCVSMHVHDLRIVMLTTFDRGAAMKLQSRVMTAVTAKAAIPNVLVGSLATGRGVISMTLGARWTRK